MATVYALDMEWVRALRDAGLDVRLLDGWENRGRPSSTGSLAATGQLNHHTGSSGDGIGANEWMFSRGRSDLPAPLCQVTVDRKGVVWVGAAKRANHAGKAKASGPMPAGDGNRLYLGYEHQNNGTEGWGKPQYEAMVTLNAVTADHYDWSADHSRAHKETSVTGKWDPGALVMSRFREDISHAMQGTRAPKMNDVQLGNVALAQSLALMRKAIGHYRKARTPDGKKRPVVAAGAVTLRGAYGVAGAVFKRNPKK